MPLIVITPPTMDPVSVSEAKSHPAFHVDGSEDDSAIAGLIASARGKGEAITRRAFMPQTLELVLDEFPRVIVLPCPPLVSVTSIKYIDGDGVEQTLSASMYSVDTSSEPGKIVEAYGQSWPSTRDIPNAVRVRYVAGYASAALVPAEIKTWITIIAATMYDNSQAIVVGQTVASIPRDFIDGLLDPYRIFLL